MSRITNLARLATAGFVVAAACDSGTGGGLIDLRVDARSLPTDDAPLGTFTTDTGWTVVLTEAKLALSAMYAFAPDPDVPSPFAMLFGPSIARAHGGVDPLSGRRVRAEVLTPITFDLLSAGLVDLGTIRAEEGEVDAVELRFGDASGVGATHGHHAYFAGVATRDTEEVAFEGGIDVPDDGTKRRVEGVTIEATLTEGAVLSLGAVAGTFFRGTNFEDLPLPDGDDVHPLALGSQPYEAVSLGIRNPAAFTATVAEVAP